MKVMKIYLKLALIQFSACVLIMIILTAVKFLYSDVFNVISEAFDTYAHYDTDISLVYEGK